ncbi:Dps family protein [Actinoplanes sp. NPDC051494]|uniref:Dps family protein n=1 Tax=Actinoplanes sp. NPDC051494 TaxID=3363907 RepID=UPI003795769D
MSTATDTVFRATPALTESLQRVLVDLVALHLQAKQAHWTIVGTNFRDLHLQLDELVDVTREASDTIAERMRALDAVPDARPGTVAAHATIGDLDAAEIDTAHAADLVTAMIRRAAGTVRQIHDTVDAADPTSADLLHTVLHDLEKQAWLIGSETRTPRR